MAINAAWNKRYGPGGGTRRLHHLALRGRNRIDMRGKDAAFARYGIRRYRAEHIVANDNYAEVRLAA